MWALSNRYSRDEGMCTREPDPLRHKLRKLGLSAYHIPGKHSVDT